jgi:hypothetical protein
MKVSIEVNAEDLAEELVSEWTYSEAMEFLLKIDLALASSDFTEELIKRLCKSLRGDYSDDDWRDLIETLRKVKAK